MQCSSSYIITFWNFLNVKWYIYCFLQSKDSVPKRGEYNVYSTFQSHEPEFDYLKSLEIEEKINKIRWLKRKNPAHFLLSTNGKIEFYVAIISILCDFFFCLSYRIVYLCIILILDSIFSDKTIKLWRVSERDKKVEGYNLREEDGNLKDPSTISQLRVRTPFI